MMGIYRSFAGTLRVRILSADMPECLRVLEREYVTAYSIRIADSVTLEMTVTRRDFERLKYVCQRKGYELQLVERKGLFWPIRALLCRPLLVVGMALLIALAVCIPGRILFISTEGNHAVPARYILAEAEECGLKFWSRRRAIRSEQVKNSLLESIPQLQWVGVNTYGCRAVITVRERTEELSDKTEMAVSNIAASRDGVIHSCTVTKGSRNCVAGQAVRKGDILISGYTDCGLIYTAEQAEGEVMAQTQREMCVITPRFYQVQSPIGRTDTRFALLIGKKRINFYKGSGISGATCDKMYSKYVLTLPGGFTLPVALLKETAVSCCMTESAVNDASQMLEDFAAAYLKGQMTNGTILRKSETLSESEGIFRLDGVYDCLENIGIVQDEKIGEFNG